MMNRIKFLVIFLFIGEFSHSQWVQKGADIDGNMSGDRSGSAVSISSDGSTIAICAYLGGANGFGSGYLTIYSWNGAAWVQKGTVIESETPGDFMGSLGTVSISSDGNIVAIGAPENDGTANKAGHVRIFEWNGTSWLQKGLDIDGEALQDYSGTVSLSSNGLTVAIGASGNSGNGVEAGHTRVYEWNGSAWIQKGVDIDGEAAVDRSGFAVAISSNGNILAIGAPGNDDNGSDAGSLRVYEWNGSTWNQKGIDIDGEAAGDFFGWAASISDDGNIIAIGAPFNQNAGFNAGSVSIYEWSGVAWVQKGIDIDGEANYTGGYSTSISSNGNIIAVGSQGQTRTFEWDGTAWIAKGMTLSGEQIDDANGTAVSLSADGNTLAIGAYLNDGNGTDAGHVRVYEWSSLGVMESDFEEEILVLNNPTNGNFSVDLGAIYASVDISILDINGKLIRSEKYGQDQVIHLTIKEPNGLYFLRVIAGDKKAVIRLIRN